QVLSLGMEQTMLSEFLSLRVGTYKNVQDAGSVFTPTAGLGIRIYSFRLDLAGGYDFDKRNALASGALALTFLMVYLADENPFSSYNFLHHNRIFVLCRA